MTLIEAAKLARDAFEWNFNTDLDNIPACERWAKMLKENIAALNQAIAKAEQQKPVVWMYVNRSTHETVFQKHMRSFINHSQWKEVSLYGEPLANHELQCVCGAVWCGDEMVHLPDKRPPASKPWQWLTDDEIESCNNTTTDWGEPCVWLWDDDFEEGGLQFARAIEAKLKEKNT